MRKLFTSESVTEGHPDKVCDRISDAVLDAILEKDPYARVACETAVTTGMVLVMGEISTDSYVDIPGTVRRTLKEIGYDGPDAGFDGNTCAVLTTIDEQSPDISMGVMGSLEAKNGSADEMDTLGAGDQGMVFGYACNETPEYLPLPIVLAHKLAYKLSQTRKDGTIPLILPDGKTQVTVEYGDDGKPVGINTIIVSTQHVPEITQEELTEALIAYVIDPVIKSYAKNLGIEGDNVNLFINPTGRFVKGGPAADSGLTGRKIIVDTYGGWGRHGGGAFSGKDPTKVDRSAAYMARYIAKNIVASGYADKCEIQIAYAIGVAEPVSVYVDTYGTGKKVDDLTLTKAVLECFDMRPKAIIDKLDLRRPIYKRTSAYGHFGNIIGDEDRTWEKTDMTISFDEAVKQVIRR
ncbi:methionine adenosyltransferase [Calorimonas adulescens]|uniref:S-adenosylmethionine synthase n=1 Tax=Calorimonas adulescens TaxID=2606906 RepID=A0A5D8QH77_9THEO|nr:methionine adenosyltransferase [Calorimonas adulescens]TZE83554.1 methionine adenosyltransferase [Calorimonas adulescens]